LSNNCLVTSKLGQPSTINRQIVDVLYIEEYLCSASVVDARKLTDKVFTHNPNFIADYDYNGYKITWSWYDNVFQFCINYLEIKELIQAIDALNIQHLTIGNISPQYRKVLISYFFNKEITFKQTTNKTLSFIKEIIFNFTMLLFSMISIIFLALSKKKKVGSYTGDFIYKKTKSDYRLSPLYKKYEENNIDYVEFIRETTVKNFFVNIYKRKRLAIYFKSIIYFVNLLTKKSTYQKKPTDFFQSILFKYHNSNVVFIKSIPLIEKILKIIKINKFVLFGFSSRTSYLLIASKSLNITTIGIMHGLQQKEYAVYEFMESYQENKKIGCDIYGVWSPHYLEYFKKYSKLMNSESICYSGLLRPIKDVNSIPSFKKISSKKIKVLLISEPLISVFEIIPYLQCLLKHHDIEIAIKVRPMIKDIYYEEMLVKFPDINKLKKYDGKIEDVGKNFDVFIGSNSTAVIEASLFGKISILLNTKKFSDYFDMDTLMPDQLLLVRQPDQLYEHIINRVNNEHFLNTVEKIRNKFFGDGNDGSQWVINQLQ
jgi:hypothetical protein